MKKIEEYVEKIAEQDRAGLSERPEDLETLHALVRAPAVTSRESGRFFGWLSPARAATCVACIFLVIAFIPAILLFDRRDPTYGDADMFQKKLYQSEEEYWAALPADHCVRLLDSMVYYNASELYYEGKLVGSLMRAYRINEVATQIMQEIDPELGEVWEWCFYYVFWKPSDGFESSHLMNAPSKEVNGYVVKYADGYNGYTENSSNEFFGERGFLKDGVAYRIRASMFLLPGEEAPETGRYADEVLFAMIG